jgi:hypothetical protein
LSAAEIQILDREVRRALVASFPAIESRLARSEDSTRWHALGVRCRQARGARGIREVSVALGIPEYRPRAIEDGPLPTAVLNLALFFGSIVAWVTDHLPEGDWHTNVPCRRSPGRRRCLGDIIAELDRASGHIVWQCPVATWPYFHQLGRRAAREPEGGHRGDVSIHFDTTSRNTCKILTSLYLQPPSDRSELKGHSWEYKPEQEPVGQSCTLLSSSHGRPTILLRRVSNQ